MDSPSGKRFGTVIEIQLGSPSWLTQLAHKGQNTAVVLYGLQGQSQSAQKV